MTKNNLSHAAWRLRATGALVLALALSTFPAAFSRAAQAQTPAKASAQTPAKATTSPAGESKGGPKEGIKVHGHWTIDVRNPDGTLVTHREFENALQPWGVHALVDILGHKMNAAVWYLGLFDANNGLKNTMCEVNNDPFGICANDAADKTITISLNHSSSPQTDKLVLSGHTTAKDSVPIAGVRSMLGTCTAPNGACGIGNMGNTPFTSAPVPPPTVPVSPGQIIQVTVTFSFL